MGIRMVFDETISTMLGDGGYVPRFACDACGKLIDDARMGVAAWAVPHGAGLTDRQFEVTYYAHQGACDDLLRKGVEAEKMSTMWESLALFPIYLANNSFPVSRGRGAPAMVVPTRAHPHCGDWEVAVPAPPSEDDPEAG